MKSYRGKPVFTAKDCKLASTEKDIGVFPDKPNNSMYIREIVRLRYGNLPVKSKAFKTAYSRVANALSYAQKKGKVINIRYGLWMIVEGSGFKF